MTATAAQIADELYGLAPEEFTAARDKAARAARDDGDRDLAEVVKKFRRPSVAAWLVNTVARTDQLDELLDLGTALREAQRTLDGAELRAMSRQRHQVVRGLSELAQQLTGKTPADTAQREFEATLEAALADDAAAEAVRTGRLMRSLTSTGLEPVDLTDAVAAPESPATRKPARKTAPAKKSARQAGDDRAAAKRRAELAKAVEQAEAALAKAESDLGARGKQAEHARKAQDDARARTAEIEAELDRARTDQATAEKDRRDADAAVKAATRARDAAQRAVDTARKRAD